MLRALSFGGPHVHEWNQLRLELRKLSSMCINDLQKFIYKNELHIKIDR